MSGPTFPVELEHARRRSWCATAVVALAAACSGSGGAVGVAPPPAGSLLEKPGGGFYLRDEHQDGRATRFLLLEASWGRLVDVFGLGEDGKVLPSATLHDFLIGERVISQGGDYVLETNSITQAQRLIVLRVPGKVESGRESFAELVARAAGSLGGLQPLAPDASGATPFSFVARNAALTLRFNDLLDDDPANQAELVSWVRLLVGYPPVVPLQPRVRFDAHHGGVVAGEFHSTRILVDFTVSVAELADAAQGLPINSLGLPKSDPFSNAANVCLRLPTRTNAGVGQFSVLHALEGGSLALAENRPNDPDSPTLDLVRALRAGNDQDPNHGFLLDLERPKVLGTWPCRITAATRTEGSALDWELALTFETPCRKATAPGEILTAGDLFLEVIAAGLPPDTEGRTHVRVRSLSARTLTPNELLGAARFQTIFQAGLDVARACWLSFTPGPRIYPDTDVSSEASVSVRFSEPMDPDSARPFDSLMTVRGNENTAVSSASLVVGRMEPSNDLRELSFRPSLPFAHSGDRPIYSVRVLGAGGVTDLAGNELASALPGIDFAIDPDSPRGSLGSFVLRFSSPDELEPIGFPDVRGQVTYQLARGTLRPRAPVSASRAVDRSSPILSIMTPFAPGVATPLSPLGSKLHTVWRYADLGWSIRDETKYNLDVVGLHWAPTRTTVLSDFFERFEIRLAHSIQLPDEQRRAPVTGGVKYASSGLFAGPVPFENNILRDPESPQTVVHGGAFGYRIDPRDLTISPSGTPLMPFPMQGTGGTSARFTWRDTAVITRGGNYGAGVPLDSEVGPPLNLEDAFGTFAPPGQVPSVGLPLLIEIRCFPSQTAIGLNPLTIALATNISAAPNFRAYSTGGFNTEGHRITKDPDFEDFPSGGFNPSSRPPGLPTARSADNSVYFGQLDYVVRVSRAHTIWIDTHTERARFSEVVLEPPDGARPSGTRIQVDFRGAERFEGAENRPFSASSINAYGDPNVGSIVFHRGDPSWKHSPTEIDGARYVQMRFSFVNNIEGGLAPELSAVGVAYRID